MQKKKAQLLIFAAWLCLPAAMAFGSVYAGPPAVSAPHPGSNLVTILAGGSQDHSFVQVEGDMTAKTRLFGPIGPGLRAVHRSADGRTYVLASPSPGLAVYDP